MHLTVSTLFTLLLYLAVPASAQASGELLGRFDAYPHALQVGFNDSEVVDYEIGLGAMQKVRGVWQFKHSERLSGQLKRYTWQIIDGFTANEVLAEIEAELEADQLLFTCDGRACGKGVQWANRVFRERLLYGRDDLQRYRVYGVSNEWRLLLYSSARTADRQYLHAEWLRVGEQPATDASAAAAGTPRG